MSRSGSTECECTSVHSRLSSSHEVSVLSEKPCSVSSDGHAPTTQCPGVSCIRLGVTVSRTRCLNTQPKSLVLSCRMTAREAARPRPVRGAQLMRLGSAIASTELCPRVVALPPIDDVSVSFSILINETLWKARDEYYCRLIKTTAPIVPSPDGAVFELKTLSSA